MVSASSLIIRSAEADYHTEQTFGVDLEARARSDRKRVPLIITTILTFLDNRKCMLIILVANLL